MGQDIRADSNQVVLQNVSQKYGMNQYVGDMVAPIIDNAPHKGKIWKDVPDDWFRDDMQTREPGADYPGGNSQRDSVEYTTKQFAWSAKVTREDLEERGLNPASVPPMDLGVDAVQYATGKVLLKKELVIANQVLTGTWADGNSGGEDAGGLWSPNDSTNTFITDINTGKDEINKKTGLLPNRLLIDYVTFTQLQKNADIQGYLRDDSMRLITPQMLAAVMLLEEIIVASPIKSTDEKKKGGASMTNTARIWEVNAGKGSAFLFHAPTSPGLATASAMYQARKAQPGGGGRRVETWFRNSNKVWNYDVMEDTGIVTVDANLGYLWNDTHTT